MNTNIYNGDYEKEYRIHQRNLVEQNRFFRHRKKNILKLVDPQPGERVLDLGCGIGTVSFILTVAGSKAVGLDISYQAVDMAWQLNRNQAEPPSFVVGDISRIPFKRKTFDKIVAADLTEHLDDINLDSMLHECHDLLTPGGKLALYTPSPTHLFEVLKQKNILIRKDYSHIGLRKMAVLKKKLVTAGFTLASAFYAPTHLPVFNLVEKVLSYIPLVGGLFKRRVCILARKT